MIKKIAINDLTIGMYIADMKTSWFTTPFLTHNFLIKNKSQIEKIKSIKIKKIFIDTDKGLDIGQTLEGERKKKKEKEEKERIEVIEKPKKSKNLLEAIEAIEDEEEEFDEDGEIIEEKIQFEKELIEATKVRSDVEDVVSNVMLDIKLGKAVNVENIVNVAKDMVDSIYRNKHAITSLARLKNFNEYTFNHCVNVAILSATFGRHLRLSKKDVTILGMGGIVHDLGKMKVPESILNKPGSYTPEEFEVMKMHVNYTMDILDKSDGIPEGAKLMAKEHHERCDGKGYPNGLKEKEISLFGLIGAIVDVYDAITSDRVYHTARLPFDALRFIFSLSSNSLNKPLVDKFIQCIGIYPIGSYIMLNTKEVVVVVSINNNELLRPVTRLMINSRGFKVATHNIIDLSEKDGNNFKRKIEHSIHEKDYNLPPSAELDFLS